MFVDLGLDVVDRSWEEPTLRLLEDGIKSGQYVGAVVDGVSGSGLCASALLELRQVLGTPIFPVGRMAYLSSVAVDNDSRRKGHGRAIVELLIAQALRLGVERIELHSSMMGEGIYRSLGFEDRGGGSELRLRL